MNALGQTLPGLIDGYRNTALIATAVRVGLFDALDDVPRSPRDVSGELQLDEGALTRFLRGLALLGLVQEHADPGGGANRFTLLPLGRPLQSTADGPLGSYARLAHEQFVPAWQSMEVALRGVGHPFEAAFGKKVWDYRRSNPGAGALFNAWLHRQSAAVAEELAGALAIPSRGRVADIGGGVGILLAAVLRRHAPCRGVLVEQPAVLPQARTFLDAQGLMPRCELAATDFHVAVPPGCDCYLLKSVLHDWDDDACIGILRAVHAGTHAGSQVFVIERLLPALASEDPEAVWLDLRIDRKSTRLNSSHRT